MRKKGLILIIIVLGILDGFEVNVFCSEEEINLKYVSDQGYDINGDGVYDYLEIVLEANISSRGIYIVEGSNLLDRSGENIAVTAYNRLFLEAGEHVITIWLEGRRIHSSGLNPVKISYIGLISEDYKLADFLDNISLSREYHFTEFQSPPDYEIGVKEGDWARYRVLHFWSSTDSSSEEPENYPEEIRFKVDNIKNQIITIEMNFTFEEGIDGAEVEGYLEKESDIFPILLPAYLSVGDSFGQLTDVTINETRIGNILGNDREINHFRAQNKLSQPNAEYIIDEEYLWDKQTGVLIRSWFNMTINDVFTGYASYDNFSFSIHSTNLIPQRTSIRLEAPSEIKLGETINITAVLLDFNNEGIVGEQIILTSRDNDNEIGEGLTDSSGHVEFEYDPDKPGEHRIKTVFTGSAEFLPSESSTLFTVSGSSITQYIPWITIIFIITVISLLFYMHKRVF